MSFQEKQLNDALNNILDCFTGADGGAAFVALKVSLEQLEKQYLFDKDEKAKALLDIVIRFSRMIEIFSRKPIGQGNET